MVTKIRAIVAWGIGGDRAIILDKDSGGGGSDPLAFCDLDVDDFIVSYRGGSR